MCNQFTFHHQFRIDTGRTKFKQTTDGIISACVDTMNKEYRDLDKIDLSKRQTASFTSVDTMNKEYRDLDKIDLDAPRLALYQPDIANMFLQYPGRGSQGLRFLPRVKHLLGCDDNFMLSVPSSTNDLNNSRWQSGEICQVLSTGDFTLFCHVFDSVEVFNPPPLSLSCSCLAHAFVCSMFPVLSA